MNRLVIQSGTIITRDSIIEKGTIVITNGRIAAITSANEYKPTKKDRIIDASDRLVCPGLIEMHTNGALGYDFLDANEEQVEQICSFQAQHGTTSFLATLCTAPQQQTVKAAQVIRSVAERGPKYAQLLGIHLEGPYFNPKFRRVHPAEHIRIYTPTELDEVISASGNRVRLFTLAPEMPGALEFITYLKTKGIIPAMGHSDATYEEAERAIDAGIIYSTHTFAAMREFHHREPGIAGASMLDDRVWVEVLSDGLHLHPGAAKLLWKTKGPNRIVIATDAMAGAGLPDGEYLLASQRVVVKEGRTISPEGRIAGGVATMDLAVRNMHRWLNISLPDALLMASYNPAKVLGLEKLKGSIEVGKDADLFVCDEDFNPYLTIVRGKVVYRNA